MTTRNDNANQQKKINYNASLVHCRTNDILLGRGNVGWQGNKQYQEVIRKNTKRYRDAQSRSEKTRIVFEVIGIALSYGGRFLLPIDADPPPNTAPTTTTATPQTTNESSAINRQRRRGMLWRLADSYQIRKKVGQVNDCKLEYQCVQKISLAPLLVIPGTSTL